MSAQDPLAPPGPELGRANRRLLAERQGWPAGAVEVCERVEAEHPGWWVGWSEGGGLEWKARGFYATRTKWHCADVGPRYAYGADGDELRAAIAAWAPSRPPVNGWPSDHPLV